MGSLLESARRAIPGLDEWFDYRACAADPVEAREVDRRVKRDLWRWVGVVAAGSAGGTLVARTLWPSMGWVEAGADSVAICLWLFVLVASPWYGYRKIAQRPWRLYSTVIGIAMCVSSLG